MVNTSDNVMELVYVKNLFSIALAVFQRKWMTNGKLVFLCSEPPLLLLDLYSAMYWFHLYYWEGCGQAVIIRAWWARGLGLNPTKTLIFQTIIDLRQKDYPHAAHHSCQHMAEYNGKDRRGRFMIPWYKSFFGNIMQTRATRHGSCY